MGGWFIGVFVLLGNFRCYGIWIATAEIGEGITAEVNIKTSLLSHLFQISDEIHHPFHHIQKFDRVFNALFQFFGLLARLNDGVKIGKPFSQVNGTDVSILVVVEGFSQANSVKNLCVGI